MANLTSYGDISPRTAAFAVAKMLRRALPYLVIEKFGQSYPIPTNSSKVAKFRRYEALALATTPLTEGVTPTGKTLTATDVTATLEQYGDFVTISDVIQDTHEDPVFSEAQQILAEQAAQTVETVRFNILKAGTNVFYASGVANRASVAAAVSLTDQRKITRAFKRQNARMITKKVASTANFNTESTEPGFIALIHPDLENDVRAMAGFINVKDYGNMAPYEHEIGAVEDVRYIRSTIFTSWEAAGAVTGAGTSFVSSDSTNNDVYPILYIASDAYGLVPLKGKDSLTPMVKNPGMPSDSDPLGQRGFVSWKAMTTAVILNQLWMARLECAASEL